tara:strand:+ start:10352 stop:11143 length:792 start_codon:yes stop_codon:yes gene_type:complete
MNSKLVLVSLLMLFLTSCNTNKKETYEKNNDDALNEIAEKDDAIASSKGDQLMKQKCFICHFEKPDPTRRDQMLAPPFLRVQEHYKPAFPEKENFIAAIMEIINNPSEEKTLMPGAVRKFNLMPKLVYDQDELRLIAEALYDIDYGSSPKMRMNQDLRLNNGKKWKLTKESMNQINVIKNNIANFDSAVISDYNQLGKDVFNEAKLIMLDESYKGEIWDQIHNFFGDIEGSMHTLMATQSMDKAANELTILKIKFEEFSNYFE